MAPEFIGCLEAIFHHTGDHVHAADKQHTADDRKANNAKGLKRHQRDDQSQDRRSCGSGHPSPGGFPVGSQRVQAGFLMCLCRHVFWFLPTVWILLRALWLRRSEEHTSELQSRFDLVCRLLLEKKKTEVVDT